MDWEWQANPMAQKLWQSFMQFGRAQWHQRPVAGCTPGEVRLLICIRRCAKAAPDATKVSDLSKMLHITAPAVTQMLNSLEANGLVERQNDPGDRRSVLLTLTEKGETVTQQALDIVAASFQGLVEYLGEERSRELVDLLQSASHYFNERAANVQQASELQWSGVTEA